MSGIPSSIMQEMRRLLENCSEFSTPAHLQTLFVDTRLHPFGNSLPSADNRQQNIDNAISHLHNRYLRDGSNALVNLITVLAERYEDEYLGTQLYALADRSRIPLSNSSYEDAERYITASAPDINTIEETTGTGNEQIIGTSSLKNILWLQLGLKAAQSVCRLLLSDGGRGTGFLVSSNMLMTNNHVLPTKASAENAIAEFNFQHALDGKMKNTVRYALDTQFYKTNIPLDYTLVGVQKNPVKTSLDTWGCVEINAEAEPVVAEHLIIIQHPGGEPKQIAMTDNYVKSISSPFIRYTTDTRPGSSGAPVFNDGWQVVAIHHRSVTDQNYAPGRRQKLNEGVLLSQIKVDAGDMFPDV